MIKVVITGSSKGIGLATAIKFLHDYTRLFDVYGIDIGDCPEELSENLFYHHYKADVRDKDNLPDISGVNILINNAGVQNSGHDIETNLLGTINCTEKYGIQDNIGSILNVASVSAHNGAEFPEYCASKGGMLAYTVNTAKRIAQFGATCNSISPGGVTTELNAPVMNDKELWESIMDETPLKRWATASEIADWIFFITVVNSSMTAQDIIIDNGETMNHKFIWK